MNKETKSAIVIVSVVALVILSCFIKTEVNVGVSIIAIIVIGVFIHCLGEDKGERKLEGFKTWVSIELDEKRERLEEIDDKLDDMEDGEYNIDNDNSVPHSKEDLIDKLKKRKFFLEERIEKLEKKFSDAGEILD